jgi:hypothetical protein
MAKEPLCQSVALGKIDIEMHQLQLLIFRTHPRLDTPDHDARMSFSLKRIIFGRLSAWNPEVNGSHMVPSSKLTKTLTDRGWKISETTIIW